MIDPDRQIWQDMLARLRTDHPALCRQWFDEIEPVGLDGGVLTLRAHSASHRDYLKRLCRSQFNDAARSVTQRLLSTQFLGPEDEPTHDIRDAAAPPAPVAPPADQRDQLFINPDYEFDNFVVGRENRLAHAAAVAVADDPGQSYNPFFVHGSVGLGKTHLLQAICLRILAANPDASIYYTSCEGFMTQFIDAVQAGQMSQFRHKFRDLDLLVIDDIHFLAKRDRTQEEFFHTFNSLYQSNRQIVLSCDAPPEEIPDLEERLVSRFKWGLVAMIGPPSYETRVQILKSKAKLRGIDLPEDVACHVATVIDSNIRELEGAITRIQMQAIVENVSITLDLARAALGESLPRASGEIAIQTIIDAVTDYYGVRLADLQSKRRQRSIAQPRQVCMFLARKYTRHSLEEIGGYFGGRDHTTVMHAVKIVETRRQQDNEFDIVVRSLEHLFNPAKG